MNYLNKTKEELISELLIIEHSKANTENKYKSVIENINDVIYEYDNKGVLKYISPVMERTFGFTPEDIVGNNFTKFVGGSEESAAKFLSELREKKEIHTEYKIKTKTGDICWANILTKAIFDGDTFLGGAGIVTDITERKHFEMNLKRSELLYHSILNASPDPITITDLDGKIILTSNSVNKVFGFDPSFDFSNHLILEFIHKHDHEKAMNAIMKMFHNEFPVADEYKGVKADGSTFDIEVNAEFILNENGQPINMLFVARDITHRKQTEENLRQSEQRYKAFFEGNTSIIILVDPKTGKIKDANPAACLYYGWAKQEICRMNIADINILTKDEIAAEMQLANKEERKYFNFKHMLANGEIHDVEVYSGPLEFDDFTLLYSIVHDISERVKIENALRASEEKYRNIFETVQDAYYEASPEGIILNISPAIENISKGQFTRDDLIGKPFVLFYSDPDVRNAFYINLMIHGRVNDYELTLLNKDDSVVPVAITSTLVFDIEGNPLKIIGSIRDISERKIVEETVRTSEDKYRRDLVLLNSIFESPIDIIVFSLDTNYCYTAFTKYHVDIMKAIWGIDIQSGMNMLDLISNPDDRQKAKSNFDRAFMGEHFVLTEEYGDDVLLRTYYDNYYSSVRNGDGEIIGVSVFVIDATERTQAVLKLAQSEDRFSQVVAQSQEVVWEVNTEGLYTYVSPMAKDVYGYAPEELVGKLHFYDIFPEKEREQVKEAAFEIFSRKRDIRSFVNKVVKPDSSEIILLTNGIPIVDTHNNLVGYRGIDANVTEQKRAEENLLKVDRLRSVISNINHAIIFERSKEKLLEKVCNIAIVSGKFQMAWIGLVNEETQKVEPYKVDGFDNGYLSQVTPISVLDNLEVRGPTVAAIHEGNPFICNDIENDPRMALWKDEALKRNYRSNITIPIKQFGEILGVLSLYSTQPNLFNSDEVELLVAVVDNISNALLAIETENERSLAEAELRKLSRAVEQCPVSIIITDIEGNIEYANPKACKTTGYTFNELIGQNPRILKSGEISKDNYLSLWETVSTGKEWYGTFHNKMKTGELYWESATIAPVTDEQGTITHYVGIKEDITQRKKSEEEIRDLNENLELRIRERTQELDEMNSDLHQEIEERKRLDEALTASEQSYKTVVENINEIIFQTDVKGLWLFLNKSWEEVTGFTVSESLGQLFINYVHPDDKQLNLDLFESLINRDKDYFRHEIRYLTKDGEFRWIELFARLGINENDEITGTYGTLQDITERKIADDEIRKARLEAEQANTAKSEFLSRMSHELRTPMNSILGFAQILEMGELDLGQKIGVSHILSSGKHLLSLINEVLDISRIEAGHLSMSVEQIKINNILEEMLDVMRPLASERQIDLTLVPSPDNQLFVNFDRQSLKQVMLNLLSNAIKYNKPLGSVVVKTQLIPPTDDGKAFIRISIADTGVGLSAVDIPKIFTPFERVGADKTGIEGTGLGLAVVKKIIDVMGGFISVESSLGKGSTFLIDLPKAEIQLNNLQKLELLSDTNSKYVERRRTVLYIEDNASNIELVKQILLIQRPDIQLVSDGNGTQAVRLATEYKPDLILLDLNLPDIHGSEVIKLLLADKKTKNIPVVVISADAMHLQVEKLIEAGAKTYLTKPLVVVDFSKVIDEYIYN